MIKNINYIKGIFIFCCSIILCGSGTGFAQNPVSPDGSEPLEITAQESLEWHRNELFFRASEEVKAVQGGTTLYCDEMIAKYRDSEKSNIDVYQVEAIGSVRILSADSKAYGDKAIYNMDKGLAEMTGSNLRLLSKDQNVRARDKFLYWVTEGRLEALGKAEAVREGDKIEADKLVAVFDQGSGAQRTLRSLEAVGNVVITTPEEVLTGEHAFYSAKTGLAELNDNVRITRGESFLEGARAQVDLNTNISKIFGPEPEVSASGEAKPESEGGMAAGEITETEGGRVRAVFYPKKLKKE